MHTHPKCKKKKSQMWLKLLKRHICGQTTQQLHSHSSVLHSLGRSHHAKLTFSTRFSCKSWAASPLQRGDQFIGHLEGGSDQGPVTVKTSTIWGLVQENCQQITFFSSFLFVEEALQGQRTHLNDRNLVSTPQTHIQPTL